MQSNHSVYITPSPHLVLTSDNHFLVKCTLKGTRGRIPATLAISSSETNRSIIPSIVPTRKQALSWEERYHAPSCRWAQASSSFSPSSSIANWKLLSTTHQRQAFLIDPVDAHFLPQLRRIDLVRISAKFPVSASSRHFSTVVSRTRPSGAFQIPVRCASKIAVESRETTSVRFSIVAGHRFVCGLQTVQPHDPATFLPV